MDQAPSPPHFTLELVRHDPSCRAPERNHAILAPENARDGDAPQTAPVSDPEIYYNTDPPEVIEGTADTKATPEASSQPRRYSTPLMILISALLAVIVTGVAVGVGVGIGVKRKRSTDNSPTTLPITRAASTLTVIATPRSTSTVAALSSQKSILSDTSLTVVEMRNGDRRLFFQEQSGIIRQGLYSASTQKWSADSDFIVASDARNNTPVAAVDATLWPPDDNSPPTLAVFYVSTNDTLACRYFRAGAWQDPFLRSDSFSYPDVSTHTVAAKSRHLAVVAVVTNHSTVVFLLYESASSGINLLKCSYNKPEWKWSNFSSSLIHKAHGLGLELSAPFTVESRNETEYFEMLLAAKKDGAYLSDLVTAYPDGNSTSVTPGSTSIPSITPYTDFLALTLAAVDEPLSGFTYHTLWVNGTILTDGDIILKPKSSYPYKRLAGLGGMNSTSYSVYHQLNATTFAEDVWHENLGVWTSTDISVDVN